MNLNVLKHTYSRIIVVSWQLVTLSPPLHVLVLKNLCCMSFKSSQHRRRRLKKLSNITMIMRPCKSCIKSKKRCIVSNDANKCIECIRREVPCDLTSLNTLRWKRLKKKRKKLKTNLKKTFFDQQKLLIKQQRLIKELNFVEKKQQSIVDSKYRNIENLKKQKLSNLSPFIDVIFEQLFLPFIDDD